MFTSLNGNQAALRSGARNRSGFSVVSQEDGNNALQAADSSPAVSGLLHGGTIVAAVAPPALAICFALDQSGSLFITDFQKSKGFANAVIAGVAAASPTSRFGAVKYDDTVETVTNLVDASTAQTAISAAVFGNGGTNAALGIKACYDNTNTAFPTGVLSKPEAAGLARMIIVITDGDLDEVDNALVQSLKVARVVGDPDPTHKEAISLVTVAACKVASFCDAWVAGISQSKYFKVSNFDQLQNLVPALVRQVTCDIDAAISTRLSVAVSGGSTACLCAGGAPVTSSATVTLSNVGLCDISAPVTFTLSVAPATALLALVDITPGASGSPSTATCVPNLSAHTLTCQVPSGSTLTGGDNWVFLVRWTGTMDGSGMHVTSTLAMQPLIDNNPNNDVSTAASAGDVTYCPPPTGGDTHIAGHSGPGCQQGPFQNRACLADCAAGSSGGWSRCRLSITPGVYNWETHNCATDCSPSTLPAVPGTTWSCTEAPTPNGETCHGVCAANEGFMGAPTVVCLGADKWDSVVDGCTKVACVGSPPPAQGAAWHCDGQTTRVGKSCAAVCSDDLTGSPRSVCQPDGSWGPVVGDACVDCNTNKLEASAPQTPFPFDASTVSAKFKLTAPHIQGFVELVATEHGLNPCSTEPAALSGPQPDGTEIIVTCRTSRFETGSHTIALTAKFSGSNGCPAGSLTELAQVVVGAELALAPSVTLTLQPAATAACKNNGNTISTFFRYAVTPVGGSWSKLHLERSARSSDPNVECVATHSEEGDVLAGTMHVGCSGRFEALSSLTITAFLQASVEGSAAGTASSATTIQLVCCGRTTAYAVPPSQTCSACGQSRTQVDGVWLEGPVSNAEIRAAPLRAVDCSSGAGTVGHVTTSCDNSGLMRAVVTIPSGESPATDIQVLTRCAEPPTGFRPCTASTQNWRHITAHSAGLTVTTNDATKETTYEFGIQLSAAAGQCNCDKLHWTLKLSGNLVVPCQQAASVATSKP